MNRNRNKFTSALCLSVALMLTATQGIAANTQAPVKGAAASSIVEYSDQLGVGGWVTLRYFKGWDAPVRAQAMVFDDGKNKACLVLCDVIVMKGDFMRDMAREIEATYGIPYQNVMISASHSHHTPYPENWSKAEERERQPFNQAFRKAILNAVGGSLEKLKGGMGANSYFALSYATVGQNSRVLLPDGLANWVPLDTDLGYNRPTGPFDAEMPVLSFKDADGRLEAVLYNHSTHNIGSRGDVHSPGFYGLASQEVEGEIGGSVVFLPGAFGSNHVFGKGPMGDGDTNERVIRVKNGIKKGVVDGGKHLLRGIAAVRQKFEFKGVSFNEEEQHAAVTYYCNKYFSDYAKDLIPAFQKGRKKFEPLQGVAQETELQVIRIGDIAFVGVPGELFGELGMQIKHQSPFRYTYVVGIANDYIGYIPDKDAYQFGGYQLWAGPCPSEKGTGEKLVAETISILRDLHAKLPKGE